MTLAVTEEFTRLLETQRIAGRDRSLARTLSERFEKLLRDDHHAPTLMPTSTRPKQR